MWRKWLKEIHWPLVFSALGLVAVGTMFIFSASYHNAGHYMAKHLFWMSASFLILFLVPILGYRTLLSISYLLYGITVALLAAVLACEVTDTCHHRLRLKDVLGRQFHAATGKQLLALEHASGAVEPIDDRGARRKLAV